VNRWVTYEAAHDDLATLPPQERLPRLLVEYGGGGLSLSIADLRRLFLDVWPDAPSTTADDRQVLRLLRWIAPVRDVESYLSGTQTIYRGADGAEDAIRWTLDESVARQENGGAIVRGAVEAGDVLAHLMTDGRNQVLVDPDDVRDIAPV
jgi:hypothetical protein